MASAAAERVRARQAAGFGSTAPATAASTSSQAQPEAAVVAGPLGFPAAPVAPGYLTVCCVVVFFLKKVGKRGEAKTIREEKDEGTETRR